jgi:hypothetical protein
MLTFFLQHAEEHFSNLLRQSVRFIQQLGIAHLECASDFELCLQLKV